MFARLTQLFGKTVSRKEVIPHSDYLDSSGDLADLERCMRQVDENDHTYRVPFCGAVSRGQNAFASNF